MKSKNKIEQQLSKKTNKDLVRTIICAKKKAKWLEVAMILSGPRVKKVAVNLTKINEEAEDGEVVIVPGKVLSEGDLDKKIKIAALSFSEKAKEKILNSKGEILSIFDEIKSNPEAKKVRIIK